MVFAMAARLSKLGRGDDGSAEAVSGGLRSAAA
jgi:hypothetical protein